MVEDGITYRTVLQGLLRRTQNNPEKRADYERQLFVPPMPRELAYLHKVYWRLRRRKASSGFGPSPIEWPDLAGFEHFTGFELSPWEVEIIEDIDDLFLASRNKPSHEPPPGEETNG